MVVCWDQQGQLAQGYGPAWNDRQLIKKSRGYNRPCGVERTKGRTFWCAAEIFLSHFCLLLVRWMKEASPSTEQSSQTKLWRGKKKVKYGVAWRRMLDAALAPSLV
ncbi:hypothetical protein VFPPC_17513 [Pochonia chlamydosporia 170]|uniref:Uncharacterized protein n=1 Tax=Pochonia chlamydosporia 170 TaxID=1380566 RepID=A0A219ASP1_METCM|nr:hypothetical protein VFPPC_17513 [Pochonia chlamydosporia 170]OWT43324.1 hypothetical protein VFPPC_17513 [Pochonia chlamydosporia 170]